MSGIVRASSASLPTLTDGQTALPSLDVNGRMRVFPDVPPSPVYATGSGAASTATASLPAVVGKTNYIQGFIITGLGATGAAGVIATLAGLLGGVTFSFDIGVPAGVTTPITPLIVNFGAPLQAAAANTAITLSVPSFGAGNTAVHVDMWGFVQ